MLKPSRHPVFQPRGLESVMIRLVILAEFGEGGVWTV